MQERKVTDLTYQDVKNIKIYDVTSLSPLNNKNMLGENRLLFNSTVGVVSSNGNSNELQSFLTNMKPHHIHSFLGGTISIEKLDAPLIVYRTGDSGKYWTTTPPASPWQHSLEMAMHPSLYPSSMKEISNYHPANKGVLIYQIPAGQIIARGKVAPQAGFPGFGEQIFLPTLKSQQVRFASWEHWKAHYNPLLAYTMKWENINPEYLRNKKIEIWSPNFESNNYFNRPKFDRNVPDKSLFTFSKQSVRQFGKNYGGTALAFLADVLLEHQNNPSQGIFTAFTKSTLNWGLDSVVGRVGSTLMIPPLIAISCLNPFKPSALDAPNFIDLDQRQNLVFFEMATPDQLNEIVKLRMQSESSNILAWEIALESFGPLTARELKLLQQTAQQRLLKIREEILLGYKEAQARQAEKAFLPEPYRKYDKLYASFLIASHSTEGWLRVHEDRKIESPYLYFENGYANVVTPYGSSPLLKLQSSIRDNTDQVKNNLPSDSSLKDEIKVIKIPLLQQSPNQISENDTSESNKIEKPKRLGQMGIELSIPSPNTIRLSINSIDNALKTNISVGVQIDQESLKKLFKIFTQGDATEWQKVEIFGQKYKWKIVYSGGLKNCEVIAKNRTTGEKKTSHIHLKTFGIDNLNNSSRINKAVNNAINKIVLSDAAKEMEKLIEDYSNCKTPEERQNNLDCFKKFESIPSVSQFIKLAETQNKKNIVFNRISDYCEQGEYLTAINLCESEIIFNETEKNLLKDSIEQEKQRKKNNLKQQIGAYSENQEFAKAIELCDSSLLTENEKEKLKENIEKIRLAKVKSNALAILDTANQTVSLFNNACTLFKTLSSSSFYLFDF